jgi:hypothetical protein
MGGRTKERSGRIDERPGGPIESGASESWHHERLPDGTYVRIAPGTLHVLVKTPEGARWAEVATSVEACGALYHLATEVAAGDRVNEHDELPDGHDVRVERGTIRLRIQQTERWARGGGWVTLTEDADGARALAEAAHEAANGAPQPDVLGAAAGAVAGALMLGPVGLMIGGLLGSAFGTKTGPETDDLPREMTPEEYVGTPDDPNWEREHNKVVVSEAVRRVKELAKPLRNDQPVNAADYFDLAQRLIGGIDVDAIVPTKPIEERATSAIWLLRQYVDAPHGTDPTDFVDVAVRVLHDTAFLRPASTTPARTSQARTASESEYACWVVTQRRPREVRTWSRSRKADAVREVREAVNTHKTEGGVTCHDPKKPFEVQFAWKRGGKIEATEF